jgi:AraC-like DNA-binding protein
MEKIRTITKEFNKVKNLLYERKVLKEPIDLHFHNFYEIELITSGSGCTYLNGKTFELKKGTIILLTPKDFHSYEINEDIFLINVQFTYDAILETLPYIGEPIAYLNEDEYLKVISTVELLGKMDTKIQAERSCAEKLLQAMLSLITPCFSRENATANTSSFIEKATAYIHARFKENPSLEEVASEVYFNKRYFCTVFRKVTGKTYKEYLREVKLKHALNLLQHTNLSVTAVAMESGYLSISHFNREFFAYYKNTPTHVRKGK